MNETAESKIQRGLSSLRKVLLNEAGQMSIFVALIFQVLFVFFAMVINVGLLVHDKINLQNAVDLGAYYGAQKQAEILNEIAHVNYQLRQDYKLLAWRFRVLGTLGRVGGHAPADSDLPPARRENIGGLTEKEYKNPKYPADEMPAVCVANDAFSGWTSSPNTENYCHSEYNTSVPLIPSVPMIAPFVPLVGVSAAFTKAAQIDQFKTCDQVGPFNWAFTMQMIYAYKLAIGARKSVLIEMRKNLVSESPRDRENKLIKDGIVATIQRNLSHGNQSGFDPAAVQLLNGLSLADCAAEDGAGTIQEIRTAPALLYQFKKGKGTEGSSCSSRVYPHENFTELDAATMNKFDPSKTMRALAIGEPEETNVVHSTLGYEKNPWCMAYMGVKVRTITKKPFSPFGGGIELEARAFAQPFGGRIGPWYRERWVRGAPMSGEGDRLDPLTSPRMLPGNASDSSEKFARLPNFSRFPGDTLGLKSELAMGAQNSIIKAYVKAGGTGHIPLSAYGQFDEIPKDGDVLAHASADSPIRKAEAAAVMPDLFDATYYSIDPDYTYSYLKAGPNDRFASLPALFGQKINQLPDAGAKLNDGALGDYNIQNQISDAFTKNGLTPSLVSKLFWPIRQWEHLLTAWAPNRAQNYDFPEDRFGKCSGVANTSLMIPGKCFAGGRVGYSVRLISKSYLTFENWKVGGDGEAEGPLLNPPDADF